MTKIEQQEEYYALYDYEPLISFWAIYKKRRFWFDKKISKIPVYNGGISAIDNVYLEDVEPQLRRLNNSKGKDNE